MLTNPRVQAMAGTAKPEAAKTFYRDVLGLKLTSEDIFALVFEGGGGQTLRLNRVPAVAPSAYAVLGFTVDDIAASILGITAKGAAMERFAFLQQDAVGVWKAPDGAKVAWFRDPDGNLLSLLQPA